MKIYLMRHGTTIWNEECRTQGRSQNKLSKQGKALTEEVAKKLKKEKIDVIYSSPLMRTMQSANIVNRYHNVKINRCELLTEIDQGIFAGRLKNSLTEKEKQLKAERHPITKMESFESVTNRAKEFIEKVLKSEKHKNILVVSHNIICSILEYLLTNTTPDFSDYAKLNIFGNAEVKIFEI